ncbi:apolipoprotein N-acyltransferase [Arenicella xantha]|uniref:Apolipoprotein N-acyltransferase n=2 Tax=Arenicella xantha TaxID=644221 RepID=A0A395JJW8_9GAMM|nr:apolipoprotein N-acyltransferase [Arenicella xantha]
MKTSFCAFVSIILLASIFPPTSIWPLAFIAFVPLMIVCSKHSAFQSFAILMCVGLIVENIIFIWIYKLEVFTPVHGLLLGVYFALYWSIWGACTSWILRSKLSQTLKMLSVASVWVLLEYGMANMGFLAFPWNTLAQSQTSNLWLIQWSAVFGEYVIAFFIIAVNYIFYAHKTFSKREIRVSALFVVIFYLSGALDYYFNNDQTGKPVRVASFQTNFLRVRTAENVDPARRLQRVLSMAEDSLAESPDILVFPEGTLHGNGVAYDINLARLRAFAKRNQIPIVLGYMRDDKYSSQVDSKEQFNAAILIDSDKELTIYHKMLLMPFSERLPLEGIIVWPRWLVPNDMFLTPGVKSTPMSAGDIHAVPIICWENLFAGFVKKSLSKESNIIIDIVNDNWFGNTPAPYQHNNISVFRAIENGLPLVISSNTGPSQIIDSNGRVLAMSDEIFEPSTVIADVRLRSTRTIYFYIGDIFIVFCILVLTIALVMTIMVRRTTGLSTIKS